MTHLSDTSKLMKLSVLTISSSKGKKYVNPLTMDPTNSPGRDQMFILNVLESPQLIIETGAYSFYKQIHDT